MSKLRKEVLGAVNINNYSNHVYSVVKLLEYSSYPNNHSHQFRSV